MPPHRQTHRLRIESLEDRTIPAAGAWTLESFDRTGVTFPAEWASWPSANSIFSIARSAGSSNGYFTADRYGRAWNTTELPADFAVRASIRTDRTVPTELFLRGQDLASAQANYYAVQVSRGGVIQLMRVQNGQSTTLRTIKPTQLLTGAKWVSVTLQAIGTQIAVKVQRTDTQAFLTSRGAWQATATNAIVLNDNALTSGGYAGVGHPTYSNGSVIVDHFMLIAPKFPTPQSFDTGTPQGWSHWSSTNSPLKTTSAKAVAGSALALEGTSGTHSRTWLNTVLPADLRVSASILADTLIPVQLLVRGQQLNGSSSSYYAVAVSRGTTVKLLRVVNGTTTELATLTTKAYLSGAWLDVSLAVQGDQLQVSVQRRDNKQWLNTNGDWQANTTAAINANDGVLTGAGFVGIARPASFAGTVHVDSFRVTPPPPDITPPTIAAQITPLATALAPNALSGFVRFSANVQDAHAIAQVQYLIDGELVARRLDAPFTYDYQTRNLPNGSHTLTVRAWDVYGNRGETTTTFTTFNQASFIRPDVPRHYSHVRYATLAYNGTPMGAAEEKLLRESVDLVIPNVKYLSTINNVSPNTPQLIYTNLSNLYLDLLTDWLNFADRTGRSREEAFYHVTQATAFTGNSPSSLPVNWLWNVQRGPATGSGSFKPLTHESRTSTSTGDVAFGAVGEAVSMGYPERFRELHFALTRGATSTWNGVFEYPVAVDGNGQPTAWKTLPLLTNTTNNLRRSGTITFNPPADWQPALLNGSAAMLFYVRLRTTSGTSTLAPVASRITGRDYVQANGTTAGTIPAFDTQADTNRDGYLDNGEYANRRRGYNARFVYESRLFYPYYGPMRFVTNPSGAGVADWAADYHQRFLAKHPLADGVFVDNSGGKAPVGSASLIESTDTYASDYGGMLGAINRAIAPRWVMANTSGGGVDADRVTRQTPSIMEEFALRPLANTWSQFRDMAHMVSRRLAISSPSSYIVLDTLSQGGSPTDPRTRLAALAYYYLLADPNATFLMMWGGEEPASAWSRHWFDAIAYNVGQPKGTWSPFATGSDPANAALRYQIMQREYDNALVLYKPLSYTAGSGTGTTANATATTHTLNGNYRPLNADGTLGAVINRITLRNGEGAILVKA